MEIFGNNGSNFWFIMKFEGEVKFRQIVNAKITDGDAIFTKICYLQKLTTERLRDSSWNTLQNSKRPRKCNIFIWIIFGYNAYFRQHPAPKWIDFPVFEHYSISKDGNLWRDPSSIQGVDRHMRSLTFLYRIQCSTTFIWSIFGYNAYFWQHPVPKWIYFPIFEHYNTSKGGNLRSPLAPLWREIEIRAHWLFCMQFKENWSIIFIINHKITTLRTIILILFYMSVQLRLK